MQSPPPRSPALLPGLGARCRLFQAASEWQLGAEYEDQLLVAVECMLHFQNTEVNHFGEKIAQLCKNGFPALFPQTLPMAQGCPEPIAIKR